MSAYTMWYREGTVVVAQNSYNVTGVSTYWANAGINPGDMFTTDGSNFYEVSEVTDSAHIVLKTPYLGESLTSSKYSIVRNFNSGGSSRVAALAAQLLGYFEKYIDTDMQSIHGKSAYEVAISQGYQGTIDEWLESLKAAGEWTSARETLAGHETGITDLQTLTAAHAASIAKLQEDTNPFRFHTSLTHNAIMRGKNLGTVITDEQLANIRNGTYKDIYPGDYWVLNGRTYIVVHLDWIDSNGGQANMWQWNLILWRPNLYNYAAYGTTTDGGFAGSGWYTEKWDEITELIAGDIGESHIQDSTKANQGAYLTISTAVDSTGKITAYKYVSGLQIGPVCARNVWGNIYPFDKGLTDSAFNNIMGHRYTQYAYFRHMGTGKIRWTSYDNFMTDSYYARNNYIAFLGGKPCWFGAGNGIEFKPLIVLTGAE